MTGRAPQLMHSLAMLVAHDSELSATSAGRAGRAASTPLLRRSNGPPQLERRYCSDGPKIQICRQKCQRVMDAQLRNQRVDRAQL